MNGFDEFTTAVKNIFDHNFEFTHEKYLESLPKMKELMDKTPDKWLQFHLDNSIKDEHYELAAYIRDIAKQRGVPIQ